MDFDISMHFMMQEKHCGRALPGFPYQRDIWDLTDLPLKSTLLISEQRFGKYRGQYTLPRNTTNGHHGSYRLPAVDEHKELLSSSPPMKEKNNNCLRDRSSSYPKRQGSKKLVTFADDHGLTLVSLHTFQRNEDRCLVFDFLNNNNDTNHEVRGLQTQDLHDFFIDRKIVHNMNEDRLTYSAKIRNNHVALHSVYLQGQSHVCGKIGVANIAYEKAVSVRYSLNNWGSHHDILAVYADRDLDADWLAGAPAYNTDTFVFAIPFKESVPPSSVVIHLAICLKVGGVEYWDNNDCENHTITVS